MDESAKTFAFLAGAVAVGLIFAGVAMALWNRYSPIKTASPVGA